MQYTHGEGRKSFPMFVFGQPLFGRRSSESWNPFGCCLLLLPVIPAKAGVQCLNRQAKVKMDPGVARDDERKDRGMKSRG
jgi:hypothetical protein